MFKMPHQLSSTTNRVVIHTGNILCIDEVKRKAVQNPTEELVESLTYVLHQKQSSINQPAASIVINEDDDYKSLKLCEPECRKDVKVSAKIFVSDFDRNKVQEALNAGLLSLKTPYIESVVLALKAGEPTSLEILKQLWETLEDFVLKKQVYSIGVSDIETDTFVSLYEWAKVKPGIVQINLAHCCVVPPALQEFTKAHDIQLLTHGDPPDVLPNQIANELITGTAPPDSDESSSLKFIWAIRYQVHIKCRGVLTSKGYIMLLEK
ncbi:hypothetical protein J437_LFUL004028 [Ladona fulva]|uniref:GCS light chain n=1 Tax=Ladona fulva TaxID=123851 RepID=A0A8K0JYR2_LADFU|nr:hypothetical protein J437_LFUL004028 [Ladona fulva]